MLILIAGITGNLGHHLCRAALRRGHQVRGLGRSPDKLEASLRARLESFVVSADYQDRAAYERACGVGGTAVDAIISAWPAYPRLIVDAQLLLLRAAEAAGVRRFHAATWNADWSALALGEVGSYDGMLAFARHAFLSSTIRPCHVFVGVLATTLFAVPGAGALEGGSAMWVRGGGEGGGADGHPGEEKTRRTVRVVGSPDHRINWTSEADAADFSVALVASERAEAGGFFRFCSDTFSPRQLKDAFGRARPGAEVELRQVMDLDAIGDLMAKTKAALTAAGPAVYQANFVKIAGLEYGYYIPAGKLDFEPVDAAEFPDCPRTKIEEYIRDNDYV